MCHLLFQSVMWIVYIGSRYCRADRTGERQALLAADRTAPAKKS